LVALVALVALAELVELVELVEPVEPVELVSLVSFRHGEEKSRGLAKHRPDPRCVHGTIRFAVCAITHRLMSVHGLFNQQMVR